MSLLQIPEELIKIIFKFMDLKTLNVVRETNRELKNLISNYIEKIAFPARNKFKEFTAGLTNLEIVKRIYYLNDGESANLSGFHTEGINLGKKINNKWNVILQADTNGPWLQSIIIPEFIYNNIPYQFISWWKDNLPHRIDGSAMTHFHPNGFKEYECFYLNGQKHNINGLAVCSWYNDGSIKCKCWYKNGQRHRDNGPASIEWHPDGSKHYEGWYLNGQRHRVGGPEALEWYPGGSKKTEYWKQNDTIHRVDGPALIKWHPDGSKKSECWYKNGKIHRVDGPASIEWNPDGSKKSECWYLNEKIHSVAGPAKIEWNSDGSKKSKECYLYDFQVEFMTPHELGLVNRTLISMNYLPRKFGY